MTSKTSSLDHDISNNKDLAAILKTLKGQLKAKGHTYADLAFYLDVSEVTVKRLLTGRTFSLKSIMSVCEFLNVSFLDMASLAKTQSDHEPYILNAQQDRFFADDPRKYIVFINLYRRVSVEKIKADWNLNEKSFFTLLREYEKLGLLDLYPKNVFKFKMTGLVRVPKGHLRKVLAKYDQKFLEFVHSTSSNDKNHLFQSAEVLLSEEHIQEFKAVMEKALKEFKDNAYFDETLLPKNKTQSVRLLFAFSPYESAWK